MKLKQVRKVKFDALTHSYWAGDKELIGVTSLMKKHGLSPDYSGIPPATLDTAAAKGTALHRKLEDYDAGKPVPVDDTIKDYRKLNLRHVASEYLVTDGKTVASFIDKVYETGRPDEVELSDVKTTLQLHRRALEWQLGIYKVLFERQNPGVRVVRCSVLQFDKYTGRLKAYDPVLSVSEAEVDALLEAERSGLPFVDERWTAEIGLVLNESELAEYLSVAEQMEALKATESALSAKRKEIEEKVLGYMLENGIDALVSDGGMFKMKRGYTRMSIDSTKLKKDLPDIAERYMKTSQVAASLLYTSNQNNLKQ